MDPVELNRMAVALEHGEGVPKDLGLAMDLYCRAAHLGNADAQYNLGWIYANARGVARNDGLAAYFFGLAAKGGHRQAQNMLKVVSIAPVEPPSCMKDPEPEPPPVVMAKPQPTLVGTPDQKKLIELVQRLAPEYQVDPQLALAVMKVESNFNAQAKSPKNAQGLMQLIPETAQRFNVRNPLDPTENIRGGLAYLRWLLAYFEGNVDLAIAGYNAGEGAVDRYRGIPPYAETRNYVRRIRSLFKHNLHPFDAAITTPSPIVYAPRRGTGIF